MTEEPKQCDLCGNQAKYIRCTQFAGKHYFCEHHAKLESDFLKDDDDSYWTELKEKQEPDAWIITFEKQNGNRGTCAMMGRYKDVESACDFGKPIPLYKHPPAPPVQKNVWEMFPAYLIDKCEGEIITEEGLQRSLADMLTDPEYAALPAVQPKQQEWVGLTPEEIESLWDEWDDAVCLDYKTWGRAIEARLKEKNTKKG